MKLIFKVTEEDLEKTTLQIKRNCSKEICDIGFLFNHLWTIADKYLRQACLPTNDIVSRGLAKQTSGTRTQAHAQAVF